MSSSRLPTTRRTLLTSALLGASLRVTGARAAETAVIRVGDQKGGTQSVMKAAGVLAGVLESAGYAIEWKQFVAAAPLLEALNAGAVDLAFAGDAPTTFALAAGLQGRIVGATRGGGGSTAIMVPAQSAIRDIADLKGRTIAVNRGSIGHALVLAVAQSQGWAPSDIKLANLLPAEAKSALSAGAVDAWCSWGVYVAQARLVDHVRIVVDGSNGLLTGLSYAVATDAAIQRVPAPLADFLHRVVAARRWALAHPGGYATVLAAEIGVAEDVARLTFDTEAPRPVPIDQQVIADEQRTADLYLTAHLIRQRLDAASAFDSRFNTAGLG